MGTQHHAAAAAVAVHTFEQDASHATESIPIGFVLSPSTRLPNAFAYRFSPASHERQSMRPHERILLAFPGVIRIVERILWK